MSRLDVPYSEAGARVAQQRRELISMARYVIGPDVAIRLAHDQAMIRGEHQILAPALLRSQVPSLLYQAVRRGEMTRKDAEWQLEYVRGLRIRPYERHCHANALICDDCRSMGCWHRDCPCLAC